MHAGRHEEMLGTAQGLCKKTLKKIDARKNVKTVLNRSRRAKKAEAQIKYAKANKEVTQNIRKGRRNFLADEEDRGSSKQG